MPTQKRLIVPVFIPHRGCPHQCVFCNQKGISGTASAPSPEEVVSFLGARLGPGTQDAEVAFYGGSFTCLPDSVQRSYLRAAAGFVGQGYASGIRLSTRPDCIDEGRARFLKEAGVRTVELGVQSMDDAVLEVSGRGHTSGDVEKAAACVRSAGLSLGIQIMAGLPGDTPEKFKSSIKSVAGLGPDIVRIYPTLVVKGSPLEALYRRGGYTPLSLDEAVTLCAHAVNIFRDAGIGVARVGLQPSRELEEALVTGPYHPSFGHLVDSELAYKRMSDEIAALRATLSGPGLAPPGGVEFLVNPSELSTYKGIKRSNETRLRADTGLVEISIRADKGVNVGDIVTGHLRAY